jgi:hypothetical protein
MDPYFKRDDNEVILELDSNLGTRRPIYPFTFECSNQEQAELVKRHFEEELNKYLERVASEPWVYLAEHPKKISELKARLKNWHGGKHHWIR